MESRVHPQLTRFLTKSSDFGNESGVVLALTIDFIGRPGVQLGLKAVETSHPPREGMRAIEDSPRFLATAKSARHERRSSRYSSAPYFSETCWVGTLTRESWARRSSAIGVSSRLELDDAPRAKAWPSSLQRVANCIADRPLSDTSDFHMVNWHSSVLEANRNSATFFSACLSCVAHLRSIARCCARYSDSTTVMLHAVSCSTFASSSCFRLCSSSMPLVRTRPPPVNP